MPTSAILAEGIGFRVEGSGFWVEGLRFRVQGLGLRTSGVREAENASETAKPQNLNP